MRSMLAMLAAACLGATTTSAQDRMPSQPSSAAPVVLTSNEGLQRLPLPLPVLLASRSPGYADVRLTSPGGQPLPMAWAQAPATQAPSERTVGVPRFVWPEPAVDGTAGSTVQGDQTRIRVDARGAVVEVRSATQGVKKSAANAGASRWLLDLSQGRQPQERLDRLMLDWPVRPDGLSTQVQVETSDDAAQWQSATTAALLELPGADRAAVSLRDIVWPTTAAAAPRYLRLTFDAPITLQGTQVRWIQSPRQAPLASEVFTFMREVTPSGADAPTWVLDLGGRLPLAQIELLGNAPNTVSALRLERRDDPKQAWQPVASFVAWRLQRQGTEQRSAAVALPVGSARYWRLVGDGRTSPPGGQTLSARLAWAAPQLVFASAGAQGIELQVGFDQAASTALPLSTLIPGYEAGAEHRLQAASVGPLVARPVNQPTLTERLTSASPAEKKKWLLWAVLCMAVVGLGMLAMRLSNDLKAHKGHTSGQD